MSSMCETLQLNWKLPSATASASKKPANSKKATNDSNNNDKKPVKKSNRGRKSSKGNQEKVLDPETGKYTLRAGSVKKRAEAEYRKTQPRKRGPKPRPRPLPMSKYRRKTANLRERQRMGEINTAFDVLKEKVPLPALSTGKGKCEKLTKINILHVAINYIRALENILDTGDAGVNVYGTSIIQSPVLPLNMDVMKTKGEGEKEEELLMMGTPDAAVNGLTTLIKKKKIASKKTMTNKIKMMTAKLKQRNKSESSNTGSSSSDDSGILEDEEEEEEELEKPAKKSKKAKKGKVKVIPAEEPMEVDEDEDDLVEGSGEELACFKDECPDWTELTSTLNFPSAEGSHQQQTQQQQGGLNKLNFTCLQAPPPPAMNSPSAAATATQLPPLSRGNLDTLLTSTLDTHKSQQGRRVLAPKQFNRQGSFPPQELILAHASGAGSGSGSGSFGLPSFVTMSGGSVVQGVGLGPGGVVNPPVDFDSGSAGSSPHSSTDLFGGDLSSGFDDTLETLGGCDVISFGQDEDPFHLLNI